MHHVLPLFGLALIVVIIVLGWPTLPEAAVAPPGPVGVPRHEHGCRWRCSLCLSGEPDANRYGPAPGRSSRPDMPYPHAQA